MDESGESRQQPHGAGDVGSVAEEALKLFGALSDWAKEQGAGAGQGLADAAATAAKAAQEVNEHLATGADECTWCPLCRTVHTLRDLSPEVKAHLAVAGSNLLQAAAALLSTAVPDAAPRQAPSDVEHIPVDEDWPE